MPVKKKVNFLRMKGLTAEEVQESFLRAAGILDQNKSLHLPNSDPSVRTTLLLLLLL